VLNNKADRVPGLVFRLKSLSYKNSEEFRFALPDKVLPFTPFSVTAKWGRYPSSALAGNDPEQLPGMQLAIPLEETAAGFQGKVLRYSLNTRSAFLRSDVG